MVQPLPSSSGPPRVSRPPLCILNRLPVHRALTLRAAISTPTATAVINAPAPSISQLGPPERDSELRTAEDSEDSARDVGVSVGEPAESEGPPVGSGAVVGVAVGSGAAARVTGVQLRNGFSSGSTPPAQKILSLIHI